MKIVHNTVLKMNASAGDALSVHPIQTRGADYDHHIST